MLECSDVALHAGFARSAARRPQAVAVEHGERRLTYRELDRMANRVAHRLLRLGVTADTRVAIALERSPEAIAAIIGVLKSGAAYVPLDPRFPAKWTQEVLADTSARALVTSRESTGVPPVELPRLYADGGFFEARNEPETEPRIGVSAHDLAYVIYTSGSTGRPKGVALPHAAAANYVAGAIDTYELTPADRCLQFASLAFDASVEEVFTCLGAGGRLVCRPPGPPDSVAAFLTHCDRAGVTVLDLPTAFWHALVATCREEGLALPPSLRQVIVGGERLRPELLSPWHALAGGRVRLWNSYGPTETAVCVTAGVVDPVSVDGEASIGRPLPGVELHVLDEHGEPAPVGELHVGGVQLARGYLGRAEETARAFVPNRFGDGRLYRTGDLVAWRADGSLEYRGRIDGQLKIRGFRVEPGQIEAELLAHPGVREAFATVLDEDARRLVAYVGGVADGLTPEALRGRLRANLPRHMVPAAVVILPSLPRNTAGKVDRRALPVPPSATGDGGPMTASQAAVAEIWTEVLGVGGIGPHDDFFALGGHSLLAMQVVSRLRRRLGREVSLRALFDARTPATLAGHLETLGEQEASAPDRPLRPSAPDRLPPLSYGQERLWEIDRRQPGGSFFNCVGPLRITGPLDPAALRSALDALVSRHEVLRTAFREEDGAPVPVIAPDVRVPWETTDVSGLGREEAEEAVREAIAAEASRPFPLVKPPMVRAVLLTVGPREHVLILTFHHIVIDDWSDAVLTADVAELYAAHAGGRAPRLPKPAIQHSDFARWQRDRLSGDTLSERLGWWRERLAGLDLRSDPPPDVLPPDEPTFAAGAARRTLSPGLRRDLRELCLNHGLTPYMALLAGFAVLLHAESGSTDVCVESPMANRSHWETEGLVGYLVNPVLLRLDLSGEPSLRALLARVRDTCLGAFAHQDVPFGLVVDELAHVRDLYRRPTAKFILETGPGTVLRLPGLEVEPLEVARPPQLKNPYQLTVTESADGLDVTLAFNTDLISAPRAERALASYERLLELMTAGEEHRERPLSGLLHRLHETRTA
ncbi:amino acid adenylation domain-containing protein [Actinoallomurus sp. CA-142502]|uniref:amino acid adenylation domain-containing protein n=1 Tax=Actinoallomurus sp. CA-142502 TaxID=3239885 RepID=UPI003D939C23